MLPVYPGYPGLYGPLDTLNPLNPNLTYYKDWLANSLKKYDDYNNSVGYPLMYVNNQGSTAVYPTKHGLISYTYKSLDKDKKTTKTITKYYLNAYSFTRISRKI